MKNILRKEVKISYDHYIAIFFYKDRRNRWRKLGQIGNTGIALYVAELMSKLGHIIEYEDRTTEDD